MRNSRNACVPSNRRHVVSITFEALFARTLSALVVEEVITGLALNVLFAPGIPILAGIAIVRVISPLPMLINALVQAVSEVCLASELIISSVVARSAQSAPPVVALVALIDDIATRLTSKGICVPEIFLLADRAGKVLPVMCVIDDLTLALRNS